MNLIAVDIGNTNINVGLFVDDGERYIKTVGGDERDGLAEVLVSAWEEVPFAEGARVKKRDGFIVVSSVNAERTKVLEEICRNELDEKIKLIGREVPIPIETGVDDSMAVGTDRLVNAAAAFAVIEDAVVVADFGTAVTIDMVDEEGVFMGGIIAPGFKTSAKALNLMTDKLPELGEKVEAPKNPAGANTLEAINSGLYYSAVGLLRTVVEKYAEELERWPQVIVTGGAAGAIKADCDFVDSWVPNLAVRGVVLAYKKHLAELAEFDAGGGKGSDRKK